jgi:hypothetical protein
MSDEFMTDSTECQAQRERDKERSIAFFSYLVMHFSWRHSFSSHDIRHCISMGLALTFFMAH